MIYDNRFITNLLLSSFSLIFPLLFPLFSSSSSSSGIIVNQKPLLCHKELDLYKLHCLVKENGGMERVTQELKWRSLYLQLGLPPATSASHIIKQAYKK